MKNTAEILSEMLITMLDKGIVPWKKPWVNGAPRGINGHVYRGWNSLLLGFLNYSDPRFLTFNKAKSLGGMVKKGEKGHFVFYWNFIDKKEVDETGKEIVKKIPIARTYYVFNVEQCDGLNLKPWNKKSIDNNPIDEAEKVWNGYADKPELYHNPNSAYYMPNDDYISIPEMSSFDNSESYYATLFHEMVHSTGAEKRLNRDMKSYYADKESYGIEELTAELGAQILCQSVGITNTLENSAAYCKSWANAIRQIPAKALLGVAGKSQKAVDYILGVKYNSEDCEE